MPILLRNNLLGFINELFQVGGNLTFLILQWRQRRFDHSERVLYQFKSGYRHHFDIPVQIDLVEEHCTSALSSIDEGDVRHFSLSRNNVIPPVVIVIIVIIVAVIVVVVIIVIAVIVVIVVVVVVTSVSKNEGQSVTFRWSLQQDGRYQEISDGDTRHTGLN